MMRASVPVLLATAYSDDANPKSSGRRAGDLDIPSEPLDQALTDLGSRTDLTVIVDPATGAHKV